MNVYTSGDRAPQFITLALDEAEWSALCAPSASHSARKPQVPIRLKVSWTPVKQNYNINVLFC